jgi:hypothetical protein
MTDVKLFPTREYSTRQSTFAHLPKVPIRGALVGGSGSGKSRAMVSMLLHQYRGCFSRIYVFSPSVDIDMTWEPVKRYVENDLKVNLDKEPCFFDEWEPERLGKIIDEQYKLIEFQKKKGYKRLFSICVVVDDWADRVDLMHNNANLLSRLFFRGRHLQISTLVSVQRLKSIASAIRANLQFLMVWRLRSYTELESLLEELSAIHDKKTLMALYEQAVSQPYGFWLVVLTERPERMFWSGFRQRQVIDDSADLDEVEGRGAR